MQGKTKKSQLMSSWKKKWGEDKHLKEIVGEMAGSANKATQLEFLSQEYENLSHVEVDKKMRQMGFSQKERKRLIDNNEELSET